MVDLSIITALQKMKDDNLDSDASEFKLIAQIEANVYCVSLLKVR